MVIKKTSIAERCAAILFLSLQGMTGGGGSPLITAKGISANFISFAHCPRVGIPAITAQEAHAVIIQQKASTPPKVNIHTSPNNDIFPYITVTLFPKGLYEMYAFLKQRIAAGKPTSVQAIIAPVIAHNRAMLNPPTAFQYTFAI